MIIAVSLLAVLSVTAVAGVFLLVSVTAAVGVFLDARKRLGILPAAAWGIGTLLTGGVAVSVYLLIRPSRAPAWGIGEILALTLFFVMAIPLLGALLLSASPDALPPLPIIAALVVLQNVIFSAAALYVVRVKYRLPLASIGLGAGAWTRRMAQGAAASVAAVLSNGIGQNVTVFILAVALGRQAASDLVTREQVGTPIYRLLPHLHRPVELIVLSALVGVVVPVGEEIFFRGLTFGALRRLMNRHAAVVTSALFFAGAHLQPVEFLSILILGMILAYLYDFTGSLIPGMIAHGVNNLVALFLFYQNPPLFVMTRPG
ncbi:MAG TPA: CPBP family intramembrane glutamic endopeptidase [bacterium]|nr:CPBP family intramembrane glutamic endopeptidase [bacterium]